MKITSYRKVSLLLTVGFIICVLLFFSFSHASGNFLDWLIIIPLFPFAFGSLITGSQTLIIGGFILQWILWLIVGYFVFKTIRKGQ